MYGNCHVNRLPAASLQAGREAGVEEPGAPGSGTHKVPGLG